VTNLQAKTSNLQGIIFAMLPMAVAALIGAMLGSYARHHWQHCARQVRVKSLLGCRGDGGDVTKMMEDDGRMVNFGARWCGKFRSWRKPTWGEQGTF